MAFQAGSAFVSVRPDLTNFHRDIAAELKGLDPDALKAGQSIGQNLGRGIKTGLGDPLAGPLEESTRRQQSSAPRQGDQVAGAFARGFQDRLRAAFSSLPKAKIDADASPAERRIAELRAQMEALSKKTVGVDVDAGAALAELASIKAELASIGRNATVDVRADTAAASSELAAVQEQVNRLDGRTARVNVEAGGSGLLALGITAGIGAALPAAGALGAGAGILGGSLASAGAGFGGLAAVAVPAITQIKQALQAQQQAQNSATQSGAQAQQQALALAGAQQQLAAAVRNEAYVHQQALAQVQSAEQQLAQAQVSAADAQRALDQARIAARQHIQDLGNSVIDAGLAIQKDQLNVEAARVALMQYTAANEAAYKSKVQQAQAELQAAEAAQKALAPGASDVEKAAAAQRLTAAQQAVAVARQQQAAYELQRKEAQLAYTEAIQQLKEQQLAYQRLRQEQQLASKQGVEGSDQVRAAREALNRANLQVANSERALADARANVARQDQQAADQVASARRAVTAATLQGQAANTKLAQSLAKLSPAELALEKQWKSFTATYKEWAKSLEPDVLPVLADGMKLVSSQLALANPLIRASSAAMRILESDAQNALAGPFWSSFIADVSVTAPDAILGLGRIAGHTFEGIAGVVRAFLPYTNDLLTSIDHVATRFDQWGQSLNSSSGFNGFITAVRQDAPVVAHDLAAIGDAALQIGKAVYPLGQLEIQVIGPLANGIAALAEHAPGLVQLAVGFYAVSKANQALQITSMIAGFRGLGVAEGVAGAGALGAGTKLRALGITMSGVAAETATTKDALIGLGKGGLLIGGIAAAAYGVNQLGDAMNGTVQSSDKLSTSLVQLGQTGKWSGALLDEFKGSALQGKTSLNQFTDGAKALADPTLWNYIAHGISAFTANTAGLLTGTKSEVTQLHDKFISLDDALNQLAQGGNSVKAAQAFGVLSDKLKTAGLNTDQINKLFPTYTGWVQSAIGKNQSLTETLQAQNQTLSQNAHDFAESQNEIIGFQQQLAYATGLIGTNGKAFWGNTAAALANRQALIQAAGTVQTYADDLVRNNQVTDQNITRLKNQRDQLIVLAEKFGLSHDAAKAYVDQLLKIPVRATTSVTVGATGTFKMSDATQNILKLLQNGNFGGLIPPPPTLPHAGGGLLYGHGGPRSDTLLTPTSPGEFIVNAPATSKYLPWLMAWNDEGNKGSQYKGRGYAGGGLVGRSIGASAMRPGYAGGGFVSDSYRSSYSYKQDAAGTTFHRAARANAQQVESMVSFALSHAIWESAAIVNAIQRLASAGTGDGAKAVAFARAQLGKPYVWGATGPDSFDCSGLTWRAWQAAGREIGRTTYEQINAGRAGSRTQALPGDLHLPEAGHVMMFANPRAGGSNEMIHAPHTGTVVQYAPFRGGGWVRLIASPGGSTVGGTSQGAGAAQAFASAHLGEFGWGQDQMPPLISLWNRESNWRWNATNPSSGAYGIPQSLPADKMASAGADWRTNAYTQVRWGLGYIQDRYGSPQQAMRHETNVGWYDQGGWLPPGVSTVVNATGRPEPVLNDSQWKSLNAATQGGDGTHYHAHFDGLTAATIQSQVRTGIQAEQVLAAQRDRTGRRK